MTTANIKINGCDFYVEINEIKKAIEYVEPEVVFVVGELLMFLLEKKRGR